MTELESPLIVWKAALRVIYPNLEKPKKKAKPHFLESQLKI